MGLCTILRLPGRVQKTLGQVKILSTCPTGQVCKRGSFTNPYITGLEKARSWLVEFDITCLIGQVMLNLGHD